VLLCADSCGDVLSALAGGQSVLGRRADGEVRDSPIVAMTRYKGRFVAAYAGGSLIVFDSIPGSMMFTASQTIRLYGEEVPIGPHTISVDPSEEHAVVSLRNNRVVTIALKEGHYLLNDEEKTLVTPFHQGAILSLSTYSRRPLVATCGVDRTVRIWNYLNNAVKIVKEFTENVYSVSLHPDGLSIVIGFGDKLRFCSLFFDDVKPVQEFGVRGCRCCQFSTGGHLFAAVNGSKIQIYSTLTFQLVTALHRHSAGVQSLVW
jgi:WD40 repeat protein